MNKIKQFYKSNPSISTIGIVSIIISISYILTYSIPDYFHIEPFYSWMNNIAISYIAALIFFVVQVYIPEQNRKRKCMEVMKSQFMDLAKWIDLAILASERHITIKETGAELLWNGKGEKLYLKYSKAGNPKSVTSVSYTKTELFHLPENYQEKIQKIKESSLIQFCDYELLQLLTELEKADFFRTLVIVIMLADTVVDLEGYQSSRRRIQALNEKWKALCRIENTYQLHEVEESDEIFADLPRRNVAEELKSMNHFEEERMKLHIKRQVEEQGIPLSEEVIEVMSKIAVEANNKRKRHTRT